MELPNKCESGLFLIRLKPDPCTSRLDVLRF